ncbi:MAG TPA: ElyC/SanA/YdcF family protein [Anaerolineae bacterium]|nr:ElyC/SanA/YdcF family protein [Anaerolineae bacterium]
MTVKRFAPFLLALLLLIPLAAGLFALWADRHVEQSAAGRVYSDLDALPYRPVALVLGTSKYSRGRLNSFYVGRMRAAAELYHAGKVDGILVSGDNGTASYNEPAEMAADLIALGVPAEHITADYAGFRTLDSIYRAGDVFDLDSYTVVSQPFHIERALYLADQKGHDAIGYAARGPQGYWGQRIRAREVLARAKAVLDVELLHVGPRYLGEPVYVKRRMAEF